MSFDPQIPSWGKSFLAKNLDNLTIGKKELRDEFNANYKNESRFNTAQKFNKKVIEYCNYFDIDLID